MVESVKFARCTACSGSGKAHSIFDPCACDEPCIGLGVCAWCHGTKEEPNRAAESVKFETDTFRCATCRVCGVVDAYFKGVHDDLVLPDICDECAAETN